MSTDALSKQQRLPVPRGWIVLGFVALSWALLVLVVLGFQALVQAIL